MLYSTDYIIHITQTHTQCMLRVLEKAVRVPEINVIEIEAFLVKARDVPQLVAKPLVTPVTFQTGLRQKASHGMESGVLQLPASRHDTSTESDRKEKTTAFGVNSMQSQDVYWAAQETQADTCSTVRNST